MNRILLWAGILATVTALGHIVGGTPEIQGPLFQSNLPEKLILLLYATHHIISVTLMLSAAGFLIATRPEQAERTRITVRFISLLWVCFGLTYVAVVLIFSGPPMLLKFLQAPLLILVGLLGAWGSSNRPKSPASPGV